MSVTVESFLEEFPEFVPLNMQFPTLLPAVLERAEAAVADHWDDRRDEIVMLRLAANLAASPLGRAAQLLSQDGSSTYSRQLQALEEAHAIPWRLG